MNVSFTMSRKESVSITCKETRHAEYTGNVNNHIDVTPFYVT